MADDRGVYVLAKLDYEDDRLDGYRICGVTTNEQVAMAWAAGDAHGAYYAVLDAPLQLAGLEAKVEPS